MESVMEPDLYSPVLETGDGANEEAGWALPFPLGFQVSLAGFLVLEIVLGFGSNLTVLVLYCAQTSLVDSVSNMVTVNLHVLDTLICLLCVPLTVAVLLLPRGRQGALLCSFHEACVTFSGVATAVSVLVISLDRYDMSVRPARRVLTPPRALLLLAGAWLLSLATFFIPFLEGELAAAATGPHNRTLPCMGGGPARAVGLAAHCHLLVQIPAFLAALAVMLVTYARILQALSLGIGIRGLAQIPPAPAPALQTSVSVIIALRRAVRRHRDRRERQRRVFRMSLLIVSSFLGCWAPLSVGNLLVLCLGPSERLGQLRLCFLAAAYGTTVLHPLLYAFTRQKLRRALRGQGKRRAVSALQADRAPGAGVLHHAWVGPRKGRAAERPPTSEETDRCLAEPGKS
ncbi:G-protein coupled receptor 22-like [Ornithorhynchus anatinus]|uniref:G-protein coupled receptor 22-like n=1 Tax=Ornithorhynchus anatinus TaxID=9258 RepID=UPI0010A7D463|nr:G-protein coupled receptor 22-like [Ornithorhynchus anatinus]